MYKPAETNHAVAGLVLDYAAPVVQYCCELTVIDAQNAQPITAVVRVNAPLHYGGYYLYIHSIDTQENYGIVSVSSDTGVGTVFFGLWGLCAGPVPVGGTRSGSPHTPWPCGRPGGSFMLVVKTSVLGLGIYAAMILHGMAAVLSVLRISRAGRVVFFMGFVMTAMCLGLRTVQAGHVPLRNMFDVFLCMGVLVWPIWRLGISALGVPGQTMDPVLAIVFLFPAGFVFAVDRGPLPPALQSGLLGPHVLSYLMGYVFMAKASYWAAVSLRSRGDEDPCCAYLQRPDDWAAALAGVAMIGLTGGLILGSVLGTTGLGKLVGMGPPRKWPRWRAGWHWAGIFCFVRSPADAMYALGHCGCWA